MAKGRKGDEAETRQIVEQGRIDAVPGRHQHRCQARTIKIREARQPCGEILQHIGARAVQSELLLLLRRWRMILM